MVKSSAIERLALLQFMYRIGQPGECQDFSSVATDFKRDCASGQFMLAASFL